jgi:hypothetical protein
MSKSVHSLNESIFLLLITRLDKDNVNTTQKKEGKRRKNLNNEVQEYMDLNRFISDRCSKKILNVVKYINDHFISVNRGRKKGKTKKQKKNRENLLNVN